MQDKLANFYGPMVTLASGKSLTLDWKLPKFDGQPIADICMALQADWQCRERYGLARQPAVGRDTGSDLQVSILRRGQFPLASRRRCGFLADSLGERRQPVF